MMKEKYMNKLSRSEASTIFKLLARMVHLKKNFKNIYKHDARDSKKTRCGRTFIWKV